MSDRPSEATPSAVASDLGRQVPITWRDSQDPDPVPANAFAVQLTPDGLLLLCGFAKPPLLTGTQAEQEAMANALHEIPVEPSLRILIGYNRLPELVASLQRALEVFNSGVIPAGVIPGQGAGA